LNNNAILSIKNLKVFFKAGSKIIKAVNDVSFDIEKGRIFGLVGESGCGKSTIARTIMGLESSNQGQIIFENNIINSGSISKEIRSSIQMIFQDPMSSLDSRMNVSDIIAEGLDIHKLYKNKDERRQKIVKALKSVGLSQDIMNRFPHEFSGGQRQRISIARVLIMEPRFIIADEPLSSLDVSIQAQIVNLLKQIQKERNLTFLFIAHDLAMVKYISDYIGVMYNGKLVELASADEIYNSPLHPYTKSLISAIPIADPKNERKRKRIPYNDLTGDYDFDKSQWTQISPQHFIYQANRISPENQ